MSDGSQVVDWGFDETGNFLQIGEITSVDVGSVDEYVWVSICADVFTGHPQRVCQKFDQFAELVTETISVIPTVMWSKTVQNDCNDYTLWLKKTSHVYS